MFVICCCFFSFCLFWGGGEFAEGKMESESQQQQLKRRAKASGTRRAKRLKQGEGDVRSWQKVG